MTDWRLTDPAHPRLVGTSLLLIRVLVIGILDGVSNGAEAIAGDEKKSTMLGTYVLRQDAAVWVLVVMSRIVTTYVLL